MRALVVSNKESLRTTYFIKAGECTGINTRFITYEELVRHLPEYDRALIKLEPPVYNKCSFVAYHQLCREYISLLTYIDRLEKSGKVDFLNNPQAIINTLDKVKNKKLLTGLRTTPILSSTVDSFEILMDFLSTENHSKVFLKPRFGSGAGGIMALRYNRKKGELVAYTTLAGNASNIYNTKRINRLTKPVEIAPLANAVFQADALIEEWLLKDSLDNENYDLRIVCQFGKVEHIVVRCSKGAITNLHLNNKARLYNDLDLPHSIKEEIVSQSMLATELSGLQYAGIDVLIERDTRKPYIIEVNGQGDHIYQNIYNGNNIYKKQLLQNVIPDSL